MATASPAAAGPTPDSKVAPEVARRNARKNRAVLCPLPETFLRIPVDFPDNEKGDGVQTSGNPKEDRDHSMALALQKQLNFEERAKYVRQNMLGRITISIVEAKLTKNYGVTRMDPYVRLRVGHNVYETPTCQNGAREPKWNKTVYCPLQPGVRNIDVEIYDECTFYQDSLIAFTTIPIPENVIKSGEVCDQWWPLSGPEGEDKEGMLHLVLSIQAAVSGQPGSVMVGGQPVMYMPAQPAGGQQGVPRTNRPLPELTPEELEEFSKMFPGIEKSVIQAVYKESGGNKEETVNSLLQLGQ